MDTRALPVRSDCFWNSCLRPESGLAMQFDSIRQLHTRVNPDYGSTDSRNERAREQRGSKRPRSISLIVSRLGLINANGCHLAGHSGMVRRLPATGLRIRYTI